MAQNGMLYIGVKGTVLALDRATGQEVWRTRLKSSGFVNVALDGREIYATTYGEVFRLDPASGAICWNNELPGLGRGLITIAAAASQQAISIREKQRREEEAAAAAVTAAG
jgi:outer membrane protein assembly factor BamB